MLRKPSGRGRGRYERARSIQHRRDSPNERSRALYFDEDGDEMENDVAGPDSLQDVDSKKWEDASTVRQTAKIDIRTLRKLEQMFKEADEDGSGGLDQDEFITKFGEVLGSDLTETQLTHMFMKIDANSDGSVDWDEFTNFMLMEAKGFENMDEDAFPTLLPIDTHKDGTNIVMPYDRQRQGSASNTNEFHKGMINRIVLNNPTPWQNAFATPNDRQAYLSSNIVTTSHDGTFHVWNANTLEHLRGLSVLRDASSLPLQETPLDRKQDSPPWITDAVSLPTSGYLAVSTMDRCITFYDMLAMEPMSRLYHAPAAEEMESIPLCMDAIKGVGSQDVLAVGDELGHVSLFRLGEARSSGVRKSDYFHVCDGSGSLYCRHKHKVRQEVEYSRLVDIHYDWITRVAFAPPELQSNLVITASMDRSVALVDIERYSALQYSQTIDEFNKRRAEGAVRYFEKHTKAVYSFQYSRARKFIVSCGQERDVLVWDPYSLNMNARLRGHTSAVQDIQVDDSRNMILTLGVDKTIKTWDMRTFKCMQTVEDSTVRQPENRFSSIFFDSGRGRLLAATDQLHVMETQRREEKQNVTHDSPVVAALYNSSFDQVVTVDTGVKERDDESGEQAGRKKEDDQQQGKFNVRVWDLKTGANVFSFPTNSRVSAACFDHSGRRLITGSHDGSIKVWNFSNGHELVQLSSDPGRTLLKEVASRGGVAPSTSPSREEHTATAQDTSVDEIQTSPAKPATPHITITPGGTAAFHSAAKHQSLARSIQRREARKKSIAAMIAGVPGESLPQPANSPEDPERVSHRKRASRADVVSDGLAGALKEHATWKTPRPPRAKAHTPRARHRKTVAEAETVPLSPQDASHLGDTGNEPPPHLPLGTPRLVQPYVSPSTRRKVEDREEEKIRRATQKPKFVSRTHSVELHRAAHAVAAAMTLKSGLSRKRRASAKATSSAYDGSSSSESDEEERKEEAEQKSFAEKKVPKHVRRHQKERLAFLQHVADRDHREVTALCWTYPPSNSFESDAEKARKRLILSAGWDRVIRVWPENGEKKLISEPEYSMPPIRSVLDRDLLSDSSDAPPTEAVNEDTQTLKWRKRKRVVDLGHRDDIMCMAVCDRNVNADDPECRAALAGYRGATLATGGFDGDIILWHLDSGAKLGHLAPPRRKGVRQLLQTSSTMRRASVLMWNDVKHKKQHAGSKGTGAHENVVRKLMNSVLCLLWISRAPTVEATPSASKHEPEAAASQTLGTNPRTHPFSHSAKDNHYEPTALDVLISAGGEGVLRFWSLDAYIPSVEPPGALMLQVYANHKRGESIEAICTNSERTLMLTGDSAGFVKMWDISQLTNRDLELARPAPHGAHTHERPHAQQAHKHVRDIYHWKAHERAITSLQVVSRTTNGINHGHSMNLIITASMDGAVYLWTEGTQLIGMFGQIDVHRNLRAHHFTNSTLRLWDIENMESWLSKDPAVQVQTEADTHSDDDSPFKLGLPPGATPVPPPHRMSAAAIRRSIIDAEMKTQQDLARKREMNRAAGFRTTSSGYVLRAYEPKVIDPQLVTEIQEELRHIKCAGDAAYARHEQQQQLEQLQMHIQQQSTLASKKRLSVQMAKVSDGHLESESSQLVKDLTSLALGAAPSKSELGRSVEIGGTDVLTHTDKDGRLKRARLLPHRIDYVPYDSLELTRALMERNAARGHALSINPKSKGKRANRGDDEEDWSVLEAGSRAVMAFDGTNAPGFRHKPTGKGLRLSMGLGFQNDTRDTGGVGKVHTESTAERSSQDIEDWVFSHGEVVYTPRSVVFMERQRKERTNLLSRMQMTYT